jgi:hypothetical protein
MIDMAGGSLTTKGVLIGAAAVLVVVIGFRLASWFDFGYREEDPPGVTYPGPAGKDEEENDSEQQSEAGCWWGEIIVDVSRFEPEEKNCDNPEQRWLGKATVELEEQQDVKTAPILEDGQLVTREVGREAGLFYTYMSWSVDRGKWLRRCWAENDPGGERTDRPTMMWEYDGFYADGRMPYRDYMGTIYYDVPEEDGSSYGYGYESGEYYFRTFPNACKSGVDFSVAASPWMGSRVPVPCVFGDHFNGMPFIINKHNRPELFAHCKQDPPFLVEEPDPVFPERNRPTMTGELSCSVPDEAGRAPSPRAPTGRYKVSWDFVKSSCRDWDDDGMTILQ